MNRIQHTSGTWVIDRRDDDRLYVAQQHEGEPGGRICEVFENCLVRGPEREANARLMAAAPDLLEALEDALMLLWPYTEESKQARAAIERATGK